MVALFVMGCFVSGFLIGWMGIDIVLRSMHRHNASAIRKLSDPR